MLTIGGALLWRDGKAGVAGGRARLYSRYSFERPIHVRRMRSPSWPRRRLVAKTRRKSTRALREAERPISTGRRAADRWDPVSPAVTDLEQRNGRGNRLRHFRELKKNLAANTTTNNAIASRISCVTDIGESSCRTHCWPVDPDGLRTTRPAHAGGAAALLSSCQPGEVRPHRAQCSANVLLRQTTCSACPPIRQWSRSTAFGILQFILGGDQRMTMRTRIDRSIGPPRAEY